MKEKNQYYSKNVEYQAILFKPGLTITRCELELLLSTENGDFETLSQLMKEKEFNSDTLSCTLANLIRYFKDKESFNQCLDLLFSSNIDLKFKLVEINNKTVLMSILHKFNFNFIKKFLKKLVIKLIRRKISRMIKKRKNIKYHK
jgi:hypothetical protein